MACQYHQSQDPAGLYTRRCRILASSALTEPARLRAVTRAHVIAWRKDMEVRSLPDLNLERIIAGKHLDH
jgi:hypothetical protein